MKIGYPNLPPGIAKVKIGTLTRNSAGAQAVTGVGFVPKVVIFFAQGSGGSYSIASMGLDNGVSPEAVVFVGNSQTTAHTEAYSIYVSQDLSNYIVAKITSLDADGFTLTWTLVGAMTAFVQYLAMR